MEIVPTRTDLPPREPMRVQTVSEGKGWEEEHSVEVSDILREGVIGNPRHHRSEKGGITGDRGVARARPQVIGGKDEGPWD